MSTALVLLSAWPLLWSMAGANPESGAPGCAEAYERAQEDRRAGRLTRARKELLVCSQASCPGFVVGDCRRWLEEVESGLPSVVLAARQQGRDLEKVSVYVDGVLLQGRLDGRAVAVDPGKHEFTFVVPGSPRKVVEAVIAEGQKHRLIAVDIPPATRPPAPAVMLQKEQGQPPAAPRSRFGRLATLSLAVVGAVGVAGFAGFGMAGYGRERDLRQRCSPLCSGAEERSVRRRYLLADVSLGVGVLSLATAGYLYQRSF